MVRKSSYNMPFKRRREQKTDYKKRRAYMVSGIPRIVTRPTTKNITVQIIEANVSGDRVLSSAFSKELVKTYGWKGGCGNIPSAYLTGLLVGYRSIKKGVGKAILDIGLRPAKKGSRIFAALKGGLDAGLDVPHSEEMLPKENRIKGEHIADYAKMILSNPEISEHSFGKYKDRGFNHEEMLGHFDEVKEKIKKEFSK